MPLGEGEALAVGVAVPSFLEAFLPASLAGSALNPFVFIASVILMTISYGVETMIFPDKRDIDDLGLALNISNLHILHHWDHTTMGREATHMLHGLQMQVIDSQHVLLNNEYLRNITGYYSLEPPEWDPKGEKDGYHWGQISLRLPNTTTIAEGVFMTTNKTSNNEQAKKHFHHVLEKAQSYDNEDVWDKIDKGTWTNNLSQG